MKRITDPTFRYVNAANTNIRQTFARVRRELAKAQEEQARRDAAVTPIRKAAP